MAAGPSSAKGRKAPADYNTLRQQRTAAGGKRCGQPHTCTLHVVPPVHSTVLSLFCVFHAQSARDAPQGPREEKCQSAGQVRSTGVRGTPDKDWNPRDEAPPAGPSQRPPQEERDAQGPGHERRGAESLAHRAVRNVAAAFQRAPSRGRPAAVRVVPRLMVKNKTLLLFCPPTRRFRQSWERRTFCIPPGASRRLSSSSGRAFLPLPLPRTTGFGRAHLGHPQNQSPTVHCPPSRPRPACPRVRRR